MTLELIGWAGAFFFAVCAIPQAYQSFKLKHSDGISAMFLILWILGEIFMTIYISFQPELDLPLFTNYVFNLVLTAIIAYYKVRPTR